MVREGVLSVSDRGRFFGFSHGLKFSVGKNLRRPQRESRRYRFPVPTTGGQGVFAGVRLKAVAERVSSKGGRCLMSLLAVKGIDIGQRARFFWRNIASSTRKRSSRHDYRTCLRSAEPVRVRSDRGDVKRFRGKTIPTRRASAPGSGPRIPMCITGILPWLGSKNYLLHL